MKQFDITYFYGPDAEHIVKEECIADIAKSGITLAQIWLHEPEVTKKALEIMKKYGLRASVMDPRISNAYISGEIEKADSIVKQVVEDFEGYDNIAEWYICDEPNNTNFPIIKAIVDAFRKYSPDKQTCVNLYPLYVTPEGLHDTDYTSHIQHFIEDISPDFLSYDHYHFVGRENRKKVEIDENLDEKERLIRIAAENTEDRDRFFENTEIVRAKGLEHGIRQMLIVLLTEHGSYRNLTREELLWEVNMCLVYGFGRISYFTYWRPDENDDFWKWENAMCDFDGSRQQHYYDVQSINKEIMAVGERLFETVSAEVFHIGKPEIGTRSFEGYNGISIVNGDDAVIGFFEDGCIYLVNRNYQNGNTLTLKSEKSLMIFKNGEFVPCKNEITLNLSASEGVLLKQI